MHDTTKPADQSATVDLAAVLDQAEAVYEWCRKVADDTGNGYLPKHVRDFFNYVVPGLLGELRKPAEGDGRCYDCGKNPCHCGWVGAFLYACPTCGAQPKNWCTVGVLDDPLKPHEARAALAAAALNTDDHGEQWDTRLIRTDAERRAAVVRAEDHEHGYTHREGLGYLANDPTCEGCRAEATKAWRANPYAVEPTTDTEQVTAELDDKAAETASEVA